MSRETIKISKKILNWINEKYLDKTGSMRDDFLLWFKGEKNPTVKQALGLFKKIHLPARYILLDDIPKEDIELIQFRTVDSVELTEPSRELVDIYHNMIEIKEWMKEYLISNDLEPLDFVGSCKEVHNKKAIVKKITDVLDFSLDDINRLKDSWDVFKFIRKKCENVGIIVMLNGIVGTNTHRPLRTSEFRAFSIVDNYAPLIFINGADSNNAKLFSLLHEIAHIFIGENSLFNMKDFIEYNVSRIEALCNSVAADIIVPDLYLEEQYKRLWNKDTEMLINDLYKVFHCSKYVIIRKLLDNKYIEKKDYENLVAQFKIEYDNYKKDKNDKMDTRRDFNVVLKTKIDNRLAMALNASAQCGMVSYIDVYRMTHTNSKTFGTLINNIERNK